MKKIAWRMAQQITGRSFSKEYNELKGEPGCEGYLTMLLRHAHDNVPYYAEVLEEAGVANNNTVHLSKFSEIPSAVIFIMSQTLR